MGSSQALNQDLNFWIWAATSHVTVENSLLRRLFSAAVGLAVFR